MSGSNTALLLLLSATTHLVTAASECFDVNIKYSSGAVLATHTWRWVLLAVIRHTISMILTPPTGAPMSVWPCVLARSRVPTGRGGAARVS